MKRRLTAILAVFGALTLANVPLAKGAPPARSGVAKHHMIAAANPYAAQAGLEMLRAGGSAVDAAIAAQMVLTLTEPESSGIGGGAFMLLWDPEHRRVTSFDGRETAPRAARADMFLDTAGKTRLHADAIPGGLSVGTPGVVALAEAAHRKYGRLPWAQLFNPAIRLAENGVPVGKKLAAVLRTYPHIAAMPDLKAQFFRPDGAPLAEGDTLKNPALAATLRRIAKDGAKAFYQGPIAKAIVDKVRNAPVNPGRLQAADLAAYRAVERPPVCAPYRGYRVCSMGPPSSGGIAILQILGMLERFAPADLSPNSLNGVHLVSQAVKLAFADRAAYLGDPGFVPVPVGGLLNSDYLNGRSRSIDPKRDMGQASPGMPPGAPKVNPQATGERGGTSHLSVVDDRGQAVSMTTSVEYVFGSEMMVGGFVLNNQLTDFSFAPTRNGASVANAPAPGKRPLSSMSPTLVFDLQGRFVMALGSPGGAAIISYVAETLAAMIDGGLSPAAAVRLAHFVETSGPLQLENRAELMAFAPALRQMGYTIEPNAAETSGLHIVQRVAGGYAGSADPRRDGVALGD